MFRSAIVRKRLTTVAVIVVIAAAGGYAFARLVTLVDRIEFTDQIATLGAVSGAFVGLLLGVLEFVFLPSRAGRSLRTAPFAVAVLLRTLIGTVLILAGLVAANTLIDPGRFAEEGWTVVVRDSTAAFVIFLVVFFVFQVRRIVGGRVLLNFVMGRYHRPVAEERIFLFLDIADSTPLAQRLGDLGVHALINRLFFDMSDPVLEAGGEIHRYIGDEAVITWPLSTPIENRRPIDCYFAVRDEIAARAQGYQRDFGTVPDFRVGIHGGPVVAGECGDEKQEIVYFGDTVNTASRIRGACKDLGTALLVSGELLGRVDLGGLYVARSLGDVALRGRREDLELFTVERADAVHEPPDNRR